MTLVVQKWFFFPFGKRGQVLHPLPVTYCDMLFTAFLHTSLYLMYNDHHDLLMHHMQVWFRVCV